jgi:hypothetical protein
LNLHRRHLTPEKKRERIAALLKAMPQKSNRQIAEMAKTHHHAVGSVRTEMEGRGKISHVEIRTDTKGRKQPAKRPTHAKLKTANQGVPEPRATPEKRTSGLPTGSPSAPKAEIGPDSAAENIRLRARIGELENVKHLLEQKVLALESALAERTAIVKFGEYFARHPKDIGQLARKLKAILHPDRVLHAEAKAQLDAAFKALVDVIDKPVKDAKREAQRREELSRRRQEVRERNSRKSKDAWARRKAAAAEAAPGAQSPPADLLDVSGAMTASAAETAPPATDDLTIPERLRRAPKAEATP